MEVVRDREALSRARERIGGSLGLVPTMGALHAGHAALIERARRENDAVAVSIFVNPTQFGPGEDYERYPRDEAADLATLEAAGVDLAFIPTVEAVYLRGSTTSIDVGRLGTVLEGAVRPGHFRGVATVVAILHSLVRPDRAYYGQKDGQQVAVVRRLVTDLGLPGTVVVCSTVREPDGLAVSSRNSYLSAEERRAATVLFRALRGAEAAYDAGERDAGALRDLMASTLAREDVARPDYVSVAHPVTLEELERVDGPALASVAARFRSTRLIDCLPLGTADESLTS